MDSVVFRKPTYVPWMLSKMCTVFDDFNFFYSGGQLWLWLWWSVKQNISSDVVSSEIFLTTGPVCKETVAEHVFENDTTIK